MIDFLLIAHEILSVMLFMTVFIRSVPCSSRVRLDIRFAFFVLGLAACAGMAAPLAWGFVPSVFSVLLLASVVLVELVTTRYWQGGVPAAFFKPEFRPLRRSTDFEAMK